MIRLREKIAYGLGDGASSMFWKIFGMYMMFFYTDAFELDPAAVGTMFLATRVWDSLVDPVVGVIADRTHSRWGKFRPWLLFGAVPFAVAGVVTFVTPHLGVAGKLVWAYVTYTLMMMVYSAVNVPYASLLGVISPDPRERNMLSSYRMLFAYIGSFITLFTIEPLVGYFTSLGTEPSPTRGWTLAIAVYAVICAGLFLLCFRWTKEQVEPLATRSSSVRADIVDLLRNRPWWILLGAGVASLIFNSIRDGATIYYFKYYVLDRGAARVGPGLVLTWSSLYLALGQISNMAGVAIAGPIANRIGKKSTFICAMSLAAVLSVIFYGFTPEELGLIFAFQVAISICAGSVFPLLWSMYADIADYSELRTGRRATGLVFSSSSMSQKLGWALGSALSGWLLGYYGFQANAAQGEGAIHGIRMLLSWLPAAGCVLSVVFMIFYPLGEKRVRGISVALEERRRSVASQNR